MIPGSSDAAPSSRPETQGSAGKHTPGPWVVTGKVARLGVDEFLTISAVGIRWVGHVLDDGTETCEADARLFAAAPTMLEAAKALVAAHGDTANLDFVGWCQVLAERVAGLEAAIALAEQEG